jgi:excinuclease ABC subunit A
MQDRIIVRGAAQHNLKHISVSLPRGRLVVLTGVSGSGKSSLAFDTLFAEGQRRYVESLSTYARQFLGQMEKPDVEHIEGLSPAIAIQQRGPARNPRSTVGTVTEIYDYLRVLFARVGIPHCHRCGREIRAQTVQQMADRILAHPGGTRFQVLAPVIRGRKGEHASLFRDLARQGFVRARVDGELAEIAGPPSLDPRRSHTIEVVVDRLTASREGRPRLVDSLEIALKQAGGIVIVSFAGGEEATFSEHFACVHCGTSLLELTPRIFSFNSPYGACPSCGGLGARPEIDPAPVVPDPGLSAEEGVRPCEPCGGSRLRPEARAVRLGGRSIHEFTALPVSEAAGAFSALGLSGADRAIADPLLKEIRDRLAFLHAVGLEYLTLDRAAATLSGGEIQRTRLATQIGARLSGVLYVLDEPSIGLHPRDNRRLIRTLFSLRDNGNTLIVVEHDEETIRSADEIVDLGPGAGEEGGEVVAQGSLQQITAATCSLTGAYLSGRLRIETPDRRRRKTRGGALVVRGAAANNLKGIDVRFPLGLFTAVTGVSGSGKSSLVSEILLKALAASLHGASERPGPHRRIDGAGKIDKVIDIDQSPIGRTPRSNPATYTGVFGPVRDLFSRVPQARARGYAPGRFSFNVKGGRCEACQGDGVKRIEMHFLPDVFVTCEECRGRRYNRETLEIRYRMKNIADVLDTSISAAAEFFENIPSIHKKLGALVSVGLGYARLGQAATTLSGGEAQRIKLARELSRAATGRTLYLLDEPTTGLHFDDVKKLLEVLDQLVEAGNTVVVIEHNLEVIKCADHIIDLGPEGGDAGGRLVAYGTPEEVARNPESHTGLCLRPLLRAGAART